MFMYGGEEGGSYSSERPEPSRAGTPVKKMKVEFNLNDWKPFARARVFINFSSEGTMPLKGASLFFRNPLANRFACKSEPAV